MIYVEIKINGVESVDRWEKVKNDHPMQYEKRKIREKTALLFHQLENLLQ
jgi:hypothetical protein